MGQKFCHVLFWLGVMCPSICSLLEEEPDLSEDRWTYRLARKPAQDDSRCSLVRPSPKDVIRRFYAILPYFDKEHSNTAFLHKFRGTVYGMAESEDMLDREVAYYTAVMTPLVFLQQYRDVWCILERWHRAIRLYQLSHPTEKRSSLKLLQNLRAVNQKIKLYITELPGPASPKRTTVYQEIEEDELHDKKDIRYIKELIKNLG